MRNRVGHRHNGLEVEETVLITDQDGAPVRGRAIIILDIVESVRVGLPNIDRYVLNWFALCVLDGAHSEQWLAVGIIRDLIAAVQARGVSSVKRPQDGALSRVRRLWVINGINKQGKAQHVGEKDEFVAHVGANLANVHEEFDGRLPFIDAQSRLTSEIVEMDDQPLEQKLGSGVIASRIDGVDIVGDVVDRQVFQRGQALRDLVLWRHIICNKAVLWYIFEASVVSEALTET